MSKRTVPPITATVAFSVLGITASFVLSHTVAIVLFALALGALFLVAAGTERAQRHLPDLGRLPLVQDHGFYRRAPNGDGGRMNRLLSDQMHDVLDAALDRAESARAGTVTKPAEVARREDPIEVANALAHSRLKVVELIESRANERADLPIDRIKAYDRETTAFYYLGLRDEALRRFDQAVDLGVVARSERAKLENPGGMNDVSLLPHLLETLERRLRALSE